MAKNVEDEPGKKKKRGKGKAKGGGFEREVSCRLSLWLSIGKREDLFYRSHSSGARFTNRRKNKKDVDSQAGDITYADPMAKPFIDEWCIECKTGYGRWDLLDILDSSKKEAELATFWNQVSGDSIRTFKSPMLIFRRNGRKICVAVTKAKFSEMQDNFGPYPSAELLMVKVELTSVSRKTKMNAFLVVMNFEKFLDWMSPEHWLKGA